MSRFLVLDEHGRELDLEQMPGTAAVARASTPEPLLVRNIVRATGEERWLIVRSSPVTDPETGAILYAVNVFENITEVKRAQLAESFMAKASSVLASSMDYARDAPAGRAPGRAAAGGLVRGRRARRARRDPPRGRPSQPTPRGSRWPSSLHRGYRLTLDEPAGVPEVIRSGAGADLHRHPTRGSSPPTRATPRTCELLSAIGARAVIIVPMAGRDEDDRRDHARLLGVPAAALDTPTSRSPSPARAPRRHRGRKRAPVHRAHADRADPPGSAAAGVPARDPGRARSQALYSRRRRAERGRRRLLRRVRLRRRALDAGDRRRLRQGTARGRRDGARAPHAARRRGERQVARRRCWQMLHQALRRQPTGADLCTVCLVAMSRAPRERAAPDRRARRAPPPLRIERQRGTRRRSARPERCSGSSTRSRSTKPTPSCGPGETLLLYTDGVPEAGRSSRQLGERGLRELCAQAPAPPPPRPARAHRACRARARRGAAPRRHRAARRTSAAGPHLAAQLTLYSLCAATLARMRSSEWRSTREIRICDNPTAAAI